jgi:hypothetical protein
MHLVFLHLHPTKPSGAGNPPYAQQVEQPLESEQHGVDECGVRFI